MFHNTYENSLFTYDTADYTTQSLAGRFQSFYDDKGDGGSVEILTSLGERNALGAAIHYRRDEHTEYNYNRPTNPTLSTTEPLQETLENTWSLAIEDTFAATDELDLVAGVSHEENDLEEGAGVQRRARSVRVSDRRQRRDERARRGVLAVHEGGSCAPSISSRTRFPTIFERFSTRFGNAIPNPDLEPERAINYEIGWARSSGRARTRRRRVFYADIEDMIQTVVASAGPPQITQTRNVGDGEFYGVEFGVQSQLADDFGA